MTTKTTGDRPTSPRPRGKKLPLPSAPAKDTPGIKNPYVRFRPLEKPRVALHETTLWDFPSQHYGKATQGDPNYRGATPSHIVWNLVSRFTKKNDLVVDPFVGSGTTLDVCKDLDRRARGFDLQTTRDDVTIADARRALVDQVEADTAHLVFMDPPYADNLDYSDDERCIGKRAFEDGTWSQAMADVVDGAWRALKVGGHLACFVSDIMHVQRATGKEGGRSQERLEHRFGALGVDFSRIALERGFTFVDHIAVVRRGKGLDDHRLKTRAEKDEFLLRGFSHLVIFKKASASAKTAAWKRSPTAAAATVQWTPKAPKQQRPALRRPRDDDRGAKGAGKGASKRPARGEDKAPARSTEGKRTPRAGDGPPRSPPARRR